MDPPPVLESAEHVLDLVTLAVDLPLAPYLDTLRWVSIVVTLAGIGITIYARLDDGRRGRR